MEKDIIADGMKKQNHCDTCLNQHTDKCNHCMVTEYHGQRVSNPTGYEQKPCETSTDEPMTMVYPTIFCDDAISREEAIKEVCFMMKDCFDADEEQMDAIETTINELPPVQPSRKGHWIDYSEDGYVECPYCGHATNCEDNIDELHYCFYCGAELSADMESAE